MRLAIHFTFSSLQEDEEGLTEIFKARLGTDGLAGINQVSVVNVKSSLILGDNKAGFPGESHLSCLEVPRQIVYTIITRILYR